ncbi:MAG: TonB family protein [Gammaproteobacteria bacterium]|nr:TonB family protein [Gammaproteobacteria bacterium]
MRTTSGEYQGSSPIIGYSLLAAISVLLHLCMWLWFQHPSTSAPTLIPPKLVTLTFVTPSAPPVVQPLPPPIPVTAPKPIAKPAKPVPQPKPRLIPKREPIPLEPAPAASTPEPAVSTVNTSPVTAPPVPEPEIIPANTKATARRNPKPDYPAVAKRRDWEGKVILAIEVLTDGTPGKISVAEPSGHEILDKAALETVKRWLFEPARRGDTAVVSTLRYSIVFKIEQ